LRSILMQLRIGSRFWPEAVRLHPAARAEAGEPYGARAAWTSAPTAAKLRPPPAGTENG
jgi:hypothetical protein